MLRRLTFCILMLTLLFWQKTAAADQRFAVEISVDVTASDASAAREKAMSEAHRAAIGAVAKRISTAEGAARLAAMSDDQLINFIKEVAVADEKTSPVRYMANLRVVLNEDMLREYMKERGIPLLLTAGRKILIIPVFREFVSDRPLLWESGNLWREAWNTPPAGTGAQFVPLPSNATNYSIIDAYKAQAVDGEALDRLMRFNRCDDAYVVDAVLDGIEGLEIKVTSYRGDQFTLQSAGDRSEGLPLYARAAEQTASEIEKRIKQQSLRETEQENRLTVIYDYSGIRQWVETEKMFRTVPYIKQIEIQAMSSHRAQFKMITAGNLETLQLFLSTKDFQLIEEGPFYRLKRLGE